MSGGPSKKNVAPSLSGQRGVAATVANVFDFKRHDNNGGSVPAYINNRIFNKKARP